MQRRVSAALEGEFLNQSLQLIRMSSLQSMCEPVPQFHLFLQAVQALPLVSTIWGVVLLGEYRRSSRKTYILLTTMLLLFAVSSLT